MLCPKSAPSPLLIALLTAVALPVWAAPEALDLQQQFQNLAPAAAPSAGRELERLNREVERYNAAEEAQSLRDKAKAADMPTGPREAQVPAGFSFELKGVTHNPSQVLTDAEIDAVVKPFIGRKLDMNGLKGLLGAINQLYYQKGYIVCEARLKPQRIRDGQLAVTLIEGKTGEVLVTNAKHTNPKMITDSFDLKSGEVASYRELSEDLVWFNLTNDVELRVDLRAGKAPETTDYEIFVNEPNNWTATVFADTYGSRSTGRPRIGASVTNRSVLGLRDALMVFGMFSQGSKSGMVSYSIPFNHTGTKLTASYSQGAVEVINGPSKDMDVTGDSKSYSLRLDQPLIVESNKKITLYGNWTGLLSTTSMFDVEMNRTRTDTWSLGLENIFFGNASVVYLNTSVNRSRAEERTFDELWHTTYWTGNAFWRWRFLPTTTLSISSAWQAKLSGDDLVSSQQMYLGQGSGVRGYPNDVVAAQQGAYVNVEVSREILGPLTAIYGFVDAGKLGGKTAYSKLTLASAGLGVKWPLWKDASINVVSAFPLIRDLEAGVPINKVRFDVAVTAVW